MEETLIFVQKIVDCTLGVPLSHIPCSAQELLPLLRERTGHVLDSLLADQSAYSQQLLGIAANKDTIYEHTSIAGITFLFYSDSPGRSLYIIGPALTTPVSQEQVRAGIRQYRLPSHMEGPLLKLCSHLPVIPSHTLYRTADLVFGYLTKREQPLKITQSHLLHTNDSLLLHPALQQNEEIAQMRQIEMRYEYSAALTEAIKKGNMSLVFHMIGQYRPGTDSTVRNSNPLRNAQNYCIVLNTQLRHAVEDCGIHPYLLDKLSNQIGLEIEQLKDLSKLSFFFTEVVRRYCRLVQEHAYPNLKPLVNLAVTYIKEHLSDNLTVKDTAKALTVNANYLSTQFHREMGMTFIDFVNQERANQASGLLKNTNLQIQEIAALVGYNNTSYFAKQFRRFFGQSPQNYRAHLPL